MQSRHYYSTLLVPHPWGADILCEPSISLHPLGALVNVLEQVGRSGLETSPLSYVVSKRNGHRTVFREDVAREIPFGPLKLSRPLVRATQWRLAGGLGSGMPGS